MTTVEMLKETAKWQSRPVSYFRGDWDAIQRVIPEFELGPFQTGQDEPINPYLQSSMWLV